MDVDFMDVVFLLVWVFFLGKAIFGGRGKRRDPMDTPDSLPPEEPRREEPRTTSLPEETAGEDYDYKKLRERILTSWGEKKEENAPLPTTEEEVKEESLRSTPISATIETNKVEPALKKMTPSSTMLEEQKRLLAKADRMRKQSVAVPASYSPICLEEKKHHQKKWTAEDAKKWLVYDAVFGAPRSQRPWRPKGSID